MPRFLIEIPHQNSKEECLKAISIFRSTGSHFLTNAEWGCSDDIHKAWVIIEADSKENALEVVPPWYREQTQIITLEKLAFTDIEKNISQHHG